MKDLPDPASFDDALLARKPGNRTAYHLLVLREKHGCSLVEAADRLAAAYRRGPDSPAATRMDLHVVAETLARWLAAELPEG